MKCLANTGRALIATMLVSVCAGTAAADWPEFWHGLHIGYHRNNAWPQPFLEADAMQVVAPFEVMKRNGWRKHNTIGHELFRKGDSALLAAGHRRVRWIATQSPENRRQVFVLRGRDEQATEARVASVRQTLAEIEWPGASPEIFVTDVEPSTASGAWATKINRDRLEQMAAPRLPSVSAGGTQGATTAGGR